MDVGEPQRVVYVEPLELPEPLRPQRENQPAEQPVFEPEKEPAHNG